jgi:hypothetical protein
MYLTQINDTIYKKIRGRNNSSLSNLTSFIRVFSGANNGLIIESNPDWELFKAAGSDNPSVYGSYSDGSGTIGVTWNDKNAIQAQTGAPAKPRPVITLFNVKEGQDQISKEASLNITAFSLEQLELIQQYFMEPGYSLFIEWGWNTQDGVKGLISTKDIDTIQTQVGDTGLNDDALYEKRKKTRGDYDCFFGFITGGEVTSEGNLFNVNIQMRGIPSLPAFLQSHHSLYKYSKESGPLNASSWPLYGEDELISADDIVDTTKPEDKYIVKQKRFKTMFNSLPPIKQTEEVANLNKNCEWYDFIGFDLDVVNKLGDEFQVSWLEKTGYFLGFIDDPNKLPTGEFSIPIEKFVSNQKYIRFGFAIDILNANAKTVKYTIGKKDLKSYIDVKNTIIGSFPFIFSTKKETLLIPGKLPNFSKIIETTGATPYSNLTIEDGVDLRIAKDLGGYITFTQEGNIGFDAKDKDGNTTPSAENTFKEISGYYGLLENLYINFDFFKNTITAANKNIREILMDLLNGMSTAVNGFWNFQIIEKPGDDGILTIKIFDENWIGQQKKTPQHFYHQGMNSVFLEASLNMKIPAEMMNQIINRRFEIASQPEQALINIRRSKTFFAKGTDLFLDVTLGPVSETAPPKKVPFVNGAGPVKGDYDIDTFTEWKDPYKATPEKIAEVAAAKKTELTKKVNQAESLGISSVSTTATGDKIYLDSKGDEIARRVFVEPGRPLIYRGPASEKAKEYDNLTNEAEVSQEIEKRKKARETTFNQNLNKMDFLVKPDKDVSFTIDKEKAVDELLKKEGGSFGIYCFNDPIYFDRLKNNSFQEYFVNKELSKGLLSTLLPITYKFKILGSSGIRRWDCFVVRGIPQKYEENGIWQITEVEHNLSGMQWVTEVTANYRQLQ